MGVLMSVLAFEDAVEIGANRGRLAADHAASIRRVDRDLGRLLDINEAWRSPETADDNYRRYQEYLAGTGPWAPIALPADESVHCKGGAVDSDDGYNPDVVRILNDHGWYHTVYRWIGGKRVLVEQWHFERFPARDNHRHEGDPASVGATTFDPEEDEMGTKYVQVKDDRGNFAMVGPDGVGRILTGAALRGAQKIATVANGGSLPEVQLSGEEWDAATLEAFGKE
ncbi:hypothetical protein JNB63_02180 [Microbacterium trichothecenolyticum]|uniref:hypothetical protein n=1 Tax=Microbacterium trichothecenolyticum TaxID=69370 RepID=UPI001C6E06DE|nr:hypothetical protein [Microbacterium trichothecenolyticum]MBW9118894.1 hypothetical protein [Microbacterium trichothecenolyticum]